MKKDVWSNVELKSDKADWWLKAQNVFILQMKYFKFQMKNRKDKTEKEMIHVLFIFICTDCNTRIRSTIDVLHPMIHHF